MRFFIVPDFLRDKGIYQNCRKTNKSNGTTRLLSVPGIGHLTAVNTICCTNNFICKITGKQLASYAGVAPLATPVAPV